MTQRFKIFKVRGKKVLVPSSTKRVEKELENPFLGNPELALEVGCLERQTQVIIPQGAQNSFCMCRSSSKIIMMHQNVVTCAILWSF